MKMRKAEYEKSPLTTIDYGDGVNIQIFSTKSTCCNDILYTKTDRIVQCMRCGKMNIVNTKEGFNYVP